MFLVEPNWADAVRLTAWRMCVRINHHPVFLPKDFGRKISNSQSAHPSKYQNIDFLDDFFKNRKLSLLIDQYVISCNNRGLVKLIANFVKFMNVYTCINGRSQLLQQVQFLNDNIVPILTPFKLIYTMDDSSDLPSESNSSIALAALSTLDQNIKTTGDHDSLVNRAQESILNHGEPGVQSSNVVGITDNQCAETATVPANQKSADLDVMNHQDFIFKLNKLKLWHQYWCVLTTEGFIFTSSQANFTSSSQIINSILSSTEYMPTKCDHYFDVNEQENNGAIFFWPSNADRVCVLPKWKCTCFT